MLQIKKRNGILVPFDKQRIIDAINKAFIEVDGQLYEGETAQDIADEVAYKVIHSENIVSVEDIQDWVEDFLMQSERRDVARCYVRYRYNKEILRQTSKTYDGILELVELANDELKDENSNKNAVIASTQRDYMAGEVSKDLSQRYFLPKSIVDAHNQGIIHFHDMDYYAQHIHNCADGSMWVKIKNKDNVKTIQLSALAEELGLNRPGLIDLTNANYQVLSRDSWTKLKAINRRTLEEDEPLYTIKTRTGLPLKLTAHHRLPIYRDGKEILTEVKDIKIGDSLINTENIQLSFEEISQNFLDLTELQNSKFDLDLRVINIGALKSYLRCRYNVIFADYAREHNIKIFSRPSMLLKDFKALIKDYPLSYEVLMSLRLKASGSKHDYPLYLPYSKSLARLYGYLYADGSIYCNLKQGLYQLTFCNTNENIMDDFLDCYEEVFGYRMNKSYPTEKSTSPCIRVTDGSKIAVSIFKDFAGAYKYGANELSIPYFILNGNDDIKYSFLSACIDTDRCLGKGDICYVTCGDKYSDQLVLLLQGLGYHPHKTLHNKAGSIYNFYGKTGTRQFNSYKITIPRNDEKYLLQSSMKTRKHNESYVYKGLSNFFIEGKIFAIEKDYPQTDVYDLETESHWYILNNFVSHNCCLVNLEDMLQNGTVINKTLIEKPHSFATACNIATQIMAVVASGQYGGQSITLSHLAPFVDISRQKIKQDIITELKSFEQPLNESVINTLTEQRVKEEIKRGVQTIQYQINTLNTSNGQTPFVTIFMYLNEVPDGQTKRDLAMIIEEVLRQRIQGVKNEKGVWITPAFPKLIYVLEEDNITPNSRFWYLTELAAKCTAKRLVPDYISEKIMKQLKLSKGEQPGEGDCYACMGCRSFLTPDRSDGGFNNVANAGNYVPGQPKYYGRFNQGVCTINLVDAACSAKDLDDFWRILNDRLELCHLALQERHKRLEGTVSDISPIHWQYGALARLKKGETIDKLLHGGYSTISLGYAGLWECVYKLTGKKLIEPEGKELGLKIMQALNDACAKWKAAEDIDYSLYGTPIESTTYKFARCLKKRFGIIQGVTDKDYITNSYHVHVTQPIDAFTKIQLESEFQALSPGGAITYVEVPNMQNNIPAVLEVIKFIYDNIIYAELNTKSDYCQVCGYDGEIQIVTDKDTGKLVWECPNCGNRDQDKMNVARRTCGLN